MRSLAIEGVVQTISWLAVPKVDAGLDFEATCYQPNIAATVTDADSFYVSYSWVERLPNGSATNPPFPYNELHPEINETGVFMLGANNILNGCGNADEVRVTGIDKEAPLLYADHDSLTASCFGDTLEVLTSGLYGAGIWERSWTTEDGQIIEIFDSTLHQIRVKGSGRYTTSTFDNLNGCSSTLDIIVTEPPEISIDSIFVLNVYNPSVGGAITIFVSGGTDSLDGRWNNGSTGMHIANLSPGEYTCTITDANGCELVSEPIEVSLFTSAESDLSNGREGVQIFPNPAGDYFAISLSEDYADGILELFDLSGKQLEHWFFTGQKTESFTFDIGHLENGIYIGKVRNRRSNAGCFMLIKG